MVIKLILLYINFTFIFIPYRGLKKKTDLVIQVHQLPRNVLKNRATETIEPVHDGVAESLGILIRYRRQELDIPKCSLQCIPRKDMHLHSYKVQFTEKLKFVEWTMSAYFSNQIIFSEEAQFFLDSINDMIILFIVPS